MKTIIISVISVFMTFSALTQETVMLKYNLEPDKVYRLKSVTQQNMAQTVGGMQRNTTINTTTTLSLKMLEASNDFMVVEFHFDTIMVNTNAGGMSFDINSTLPGDLNSSQISDVLSAVMHRYCTNPLYVKLSYDGKAIEFVNIEVFTNYVLKDIDSIKGQMAQFIKQRAESIADPKSISSSIESVMYYLPGKQVSVGSSWDISLKLNSGGMMYLIDSHYKLDKLENNTADVSFESTMDPADSGPVEMNGSKITNNIRGTSKSSMTIDTETGLIINSNGKYHMEGDIGVDTQGNNMVIPTVIDGETEIYQLP